MEENSKSNESPLGELIPQSEPIAHPLMAISCPACDESFVHNCKQLDEIITCGKCGCQFEYVDGYLNNYKAFIELFIDQIHPIPLVPGFVTGGETLSNPNDLTLIDFGVRYRKPPQVYFMLDKKDL